MMLELHCLLERKLSHPVKDRSGDCTADVEVVDQ
jgi:hypothetical protein